MNAKELLDTLVRKINISEPADEIRSMVLLVLEKIYNISRTDILVQQEMDYEITPTLTDVVNRINTNEPVQYILGETYFLDRKFFVNRNVLIPRPETEQLVALIKEQYKYTQNVNLLDIGTGSGCIAISLAKELPTSNVFAVDISQHALNVAKQNAENLHATVHFKLLDILYDLLPFKKLSAIISNPPYVTEREKESMNTNVLNYEPHLALFVPDADPLLFYKAIAKQAATALLDDGKIFVEINERLADRVCEIFAEFGFSRNRIVQDFAGKDRVVIAER